MFNIKPADKCLYGCCGSLTGGLFSWTIFILFMWCIGVCIHINEMIIYIKNASLAISLCLQAICSLIMVSLCLYLAIKINFQRNTRINNPFIIHKIWRIYCSITCIYLFISVIQLIGVYPYVTRNFVLLYFLFLIIMVFFNLIYVYYIWSYCILEQKNITNMLTQPNIVMNPVFIPNKL